MVLIAVNAVSEVYSECCIYTEHKSCRAQKMKHKIGETIHAAVSNKTVNTASTCESNLQTTYKPNKKVFRGCKDLDDGALSELPRTQTTSILLGQIKCDESNDDDLVPLNPSKCEASFFSVDPHHANFQSSLLLLGSRLRFNPTPTFLGVTFDRTLSFSKHVSSLNAKFFPRLKALRCISASSWGPSKESLSLLYKPFLRSLLTYASPGWFPFLCAIFHQIGTPPPSGQSRHHRLPLVLPYHNSSL